MIPLHDPDLEFNEALHAYRWRGREVPSTTQVLSDNRLRNDFSGVPRHVLELGRARGQAVHMATHYFDEGTLDTATVDPAVWPYLEAWQQFLSERHVQIVELETRYVHPTYLYAGTLDRIARIQIGPHRSLLCVLDIKTGDESGVDYQTAAYLWLYRAAHPDAPPMSRLSVRLDPSRPIPYVVTECKDANDWRIFRAALELTHARAARGVYWRQAA